MIEHKVTEHILNAGLQRSATISCSCGLSVEIANIRKLPLSAGRKQLDGMHKNLVPKKEKVEADFTKPRSTKKLAEQQKKVQKIFEQDEDNKGTKEE